MDWHPIQWEVEILLVASCHGNRDKLGPDGPSGSYAETIFLFSKSRKRFKYKANQYVPLSCFDGSVGTYSLLGPRWPEFRALWLLLYHTGFLSSG